MDGSPRRSVRGIAAWLGAGGGDTLRGRVAVVSPHLDDAVLSLGAALARAARLGAEVEVVTVLAGDPTSTGRPGEWDARAGFRTAGEAAATRREEDGRALRILGVEPVWLPYWDWSYPAEQDEDEIRRHLAAALSRSEAVLVPGWPAWHDDHRRVARLGLDAAPGEAALGIFIEQPYAMWELRPGGELPAEPAGAWSRLRATLPDRLAKRRAAAAYATQIPLIGERILGQIARWEALRGGEHIAWLGRKER